MNKKSSILIVDDHAVFRRGLRVLLEKENNSLILNEILKGICYITNKMRIDLMGVSESFGN